MSTTDPHVFTGTPVLNDFKVTVLKDWYESALRDYDISGDIDDSCYYAGLVDAYYNTLDLLHGTVVKEAKEAVAVVAKTGNLVTRHPVITAVVVYYVYKNRHKIAAKIKSVSVKIN